MSTRSLKISRCIRPLHGGAQRFLFEWGSGGAEEAVWDGCVEVFNGELADLKPLKNLSKTRITSEQSWTSKVRKGETEGIRVSIWYAHRADEDSFDETVVTIRSKAHSFSFSMDAVDIGERIFIRDYDIPLILSVLRKLTSNPTNSGNSVLTGSKVRSHLSA